MGVLSTLLFFGLMIWAIHRAIKKKSLWSDSVAKLLDKGFITKEQAFNITRFEREEQVKKWLKQKLITKEQAESILIGKGEKILPTKQEEKNLSYFNYNGYLLSGFGEYFTWDHRHYCRQLSKKFRRQCALSPPYHA